MNDLFEVLRQPIFWIASTCFTVLLSIVANLLTPRIAVFLSKIDGTRQTKRKKILKELWEQVLLYCEDRQMRINDKLSGIILLLKSIILLLFAVSLFLIAPLFYEAIWALFSAGGVLLIFGLVLFNNSAKALRVTQIADKRESDGRTFLRKHDLDPNSKEIKDFLRGWDYGAFGVDTKEVVS
ncbi:MAG: hypothetical protein GY775_00975 [Candidatus Scalindua sp.]|nr:hypothetical protein [Candidatus Scalindua sp.]